MLSKNKILYLWDLGGKLFPEKWNIKKAKLLSYEDWLAGKLGKSKEIYRVKK